MTDALAKATAARRTRRTIIAHGTILFGIALIAFPLWVAFVASTLTNPQIAQAPMPLLPGGEFARVYGDALAKGSTGFVTTVPVWLMMLNSTVMALVIAIGKIIISLLSAYAVVFFRFPFRMLFFWMIFVTLMLPVEVRIMPTLEVVTNLGLLNTYAGLTIPLIASATATLLFRQFFLTIPDELVEAAKIDGAGPLKFFKDVVVPLSTTNIAALFVILFIYGWNQYLWPLLITTDPNMTTIVNGMTKMIDTAGGPTDWNTVMATAILALLPPVLVVVLMQKWFVKGLVEQEK
jgi:sn-glycerol 3-phosphate transport system permease protein